MPAKKSANPPNNGKGRSRKSKNSVPTFYRAGPVIQRVDFAYASLRTVSEGSVGAGALSVYSLNSIWDPDVSGAGSSALGYSMYSNSFSRYRVLRARMIIEASCLTGGPVVVGYMCGPNTTIASDATTWTVQTNAFSKLLNSNTPGAAMLRVNKMVSIPDVLGVQQKQFSVDFDFSGAFGSNPAKPAYLIVFVKGAGGVVASALFNIRIVYETDLSQPLQSVFN